MSEFLTSADYAHTIGINFGGTFEVNVAALKQFQSQNEKKEKRPSGGYSIINISSGLAARGGPRVSLYSASKGAVEWCATPTSHLRRRLNLKISFTRSIAKEYALSGIRINAVAPVSTADLFPSTKLLIALKQGPVDSPLLRYSVLSFKIGAAAMTQRAQKQWSRRGYDDGPCATVPIGSTGGSGQLVHLFDFQRSVLDACEYSSYWQCSDYKCGLRQGTIYNCDGGIK